MINNAAVFIFKDVVETTDTDWDRILGVNVKGYAFFAKHAIPAMRQRGRGAIVNTASISGFTAQEGFVPYNVSKGAVMQLTRCMAADHGPEGIRCNMVCPGFIDTPINKQEALDLGQTYEEFVRAPASCGCPALAAGAAGAGAAACGGACGGAGGAAAPAVLPLATAQTAATAAALPLPCCLSLLLSPADM